MEVLENIIWILTGFIPTLISMELAWRLGRIDEAEKERKTPANIPFAKKQ